MGIVNNLKKITGLGLSASLGFAFIAGLAYNSFVLNADNIQRSYDIVSLIAEQMNDNADQTVEIHYEGASFAYKLHNVTKVINGDKASLVITNGYIYNLTALNGLSYVDVGGSVGTDTNYSFIYGGVEDVSGHDVVKGDEETRSKTIGKETNGGTATNFSILANEDPVTISKIEVCYTCETGSEDLVDTETARFDSKFTLNNDKDGDENVINVYTVEDYKTLAEGTIGYGATTYKGYTINLCNDLTLTRPYYIKESGFAGEFNGNGNTVTLNYDFADFDETDYDCPSFLPRITEGANVHDLVLEGTVENVGSNCGLLSNLINCDGYYEIHDITINGNITGGDYLGLVAGRVYGGDFKNELAEIYGLTLSGSVTSSGDYVGGAFGKCEAEFSESYSNVVVTGRRHVGGLAGCSSDIGYLHDLSFQGGVYGVQDVGGIIGWQSLDSNTYANGIYVDNCDVLSGAIIQGRLIDGVAESEVFNVGGIIGCSTGVVMTCTVSGATITGLDRVGGAVGSRTWSYNEDTNAQYLNDITIDKNTTISGTQNVGGGAGYFQGSINGVKMSGTVTASDDYAGGVVGRIVKQGKVSSSETLESASVTSDGYYVGGIAGYTIGVMQNCFNRGDVYAVGNYTGGVVGATTSSIAECKSLDGNVTGGNYTGGVAGYSAKEITDSYNYATVKGYGSYVGGVAGAAAGKIEKSYNYGDITISSSSTYKSFGGIVGQNISGYSLNITSCYSEGTMTVKNAVKYVGGMIGYNDKGGSIKDCTSKMIISASTATHVGGILGYYLAKIDGCTFSGTVTGSKNVGGIAGWIVSIEDGYASSIKNCTTYKDCVSAASANTGSSSDNYSGWLYGAQNKGTGSSYTNNTIGDNRPISA